MSAAGAAEKQGAAYSVIPHHEHVIYFSLLFCVSVQ